MNKLTRMIKKLRLYVNTKVFKSETIFPKIKNKLKYRLQCNSSSSMV